MTRYNPFSFNGEIGRVQFWILTFLVQLITLPLLWLPVSVRETRLTPPQGMGDETFIYATPLDPATPLSWVYLSLFYALIAAAFWVMLAAIVRRMRDIDRSNKWLIVVLALLVTHITLEALFSHHDAPFSVFEFANLVLLIPAFLLGSYGMLEMYTFRGNSSMQLHVARPESA